MYAAFKRYFIPFWGACRRLDTKLFRHSHPIEPRRPSLNIRRTSELYNSFELKSCAGSYLTDSKGNQILNLDIGSSAPLGYNHISLVESQLKARYDRSLINNLSLSTYPPANYSDFLRENVMPIAPHGLNSLLLTPSASEAIETAIRSVFAKKGGKGCVLSFTGSAHGDTLATSNLSKLYKWPSVELPRPTLPFWENEKENERKEAYALKQVINAIETHQAKGEPILAVVMSPIEARDLHCASGDFYKQVLRAAQERGVAVIVDETQCCFGATGELWAHSHWMLDQEESADFVIFGGRAQASGYFTKLEHRAEVEVEGGDLRKLIQFSVVWQEVLRQGIHEMVIDAGSILKLELGRVQEQHPWMVENIRGQGSLIAFDCSSPDMREALQQYMILNGVKVGALGERSVVLRPALNLTPQQAGLFVKRMEGFDRPTALNLSSGLYG